MLQVVNVVVIKMFKGKGLLFLLLFNCGEFVS